jgi:hypothetical protein
MERLINALDGEHKLPEVPEYRLELKNMRGYSDHLYVQNFLPDYEDRFSKYKDIDHCNEGFLRRIHRPLAHNKKHITVNANVQSLEDLIKLSNDYPRNANIKYSIDLSGLHQTVPYLEKLNSFVGLTELKENLLDQLIYFMHENQDDYLHTVLYGPPGTGKTEIAKLLGLIYTKVGILKKGSFVKVTRSDFVAGYLGQTAIKTKKLVEDNLGGVIFIDEAYAMGNQEQRDIFSKEALDTLCESLSDHKNELMVIIAGYKEELDKCFFSYNPGLESRFAWRFEMKAYTPQELAAIFKKKMIEAKWHISENIKLESWFEENKDSFKNYGRDVENLISKCKICHFRRIFGAKENIHTLSAKDLEAGLVKFKQHHLDSNKNEKESTPNFMYT